jgi:hypothetical protein
MQLRLMKVFECLVRQAQALYHVTMALRIDHTWEKPLAQETEQGPDLGRQSFECSTISAHDAHSLKP